MAGHHFPHSKVPPPSNSIYLPMLPYHKSINQQNPFNPHTTNCKPLTRDTVEVVQHHYGVWTGIFLGAWLTNTNSGHLDDSPCRGTHLTSRWPTPEPKTLLRRAPKPRRINLLGDILQMWLLLVATKKTSLCPKTLSNQCNLPQDTVTHIIVFPTQRGHKTQFLDRFTLIPSNTSYFSKPGQ